MNIEKLLEAAKVLDEREKGLFCAISAKVVTGPFSRPLIFFPPQPQRRNQLRRLPNERRRYPSDRQATGITFPSFACYYVRS